MRSGAVVHFKTKTRRTISESCLEDSADGKGAEATGGVAAFQAGSRGTH